MHAVTNVCMKHIYKVIYDLSVDIVTFDLGLQRSNQGHRPLRGFLIDGTSYDPSLYEIHLVSHIWPFSLPFNI